MKSYAMNMWKRQKKLCNYICYQLVKSEATEEKYEVEKMTTQALEWIIDYLVSDQAQEKEALTTKIKWITYKNNILRHYTNKELELINERVKLLNEGNK